MVNVNLFCLRAHLVFYQLVSLLCDHMLILCILKIPTHNWYSSNYSSIIIIVSTNFDTYIHPTTETTKGPHHNNTFWKDFLSRHFGSMVIPTALIAKLKEIKELMRHLVNFWLLLHFNIHSYMLSLVPLLTFHRDVPRFWRVVVI